MKNEWFSPKTTSKDLTLVVQKNTSQGGLKHGATRGLCLNCAVETAPGPEKRSLRTLVRERERLLGGSSVPVIPVPFSPRSVTAPPAADVPQMFCRCSADGTAAISPQERRCFSARESRKAAMQWPSTGAGSPSQPFPGHPAQPWGQPKTPDRFRRGSPSPDTSLTDQRLPPEPFPISTPGCPQLSQTRCPCPQTTLCTTSCWLCPCPGRDGQSHSSRDTETFKETPRKAFPAAPPCFPRLL